MNYFTEVVVTGEEADNLDLTFWRERESYGVLLTFIL